MFLFYQRSLTGKTYKHEKGILYVYNNINNPRTKISRVNILISKSAVRRTRHETGMEEKKES